MFKVLKNLKKSSISVIAIIVLLCVQAWADLALPDYTSKIVNNGIQSGGIEKPIPEFLSTSDIEKMSVVTKQEDKNKILENYTLLEENLTKEQEKLVKKYFGKDYKIEPNTIYILNDISEEQEQELKNVIVKPIMELSIIENEETASKIKEEITKNLPEQQKLYFNNMTIIDILKTMPEEQRNKMLEQFDEQINQMQDSIKEQAAVASIKTIYKNLNVDTDKLQNDYIWNSGLQMLGIALISMVSAILVMLLSSKVAAKLRKNA